MKKRLVPVTAALSLVLMFACGGDSDTEATGGDAGADTGGKVVVLQDIAFKPERISVRRGDTVTWRFRDKGIPHNVVADDGSFKSETTDSGTFEHTFDTAGSFGYTCTVHPDTMKGTVQVS
ncbi:MAG: plastocyanin/azurin family copper-binding protein [Actinomycetota bacterium]|nr:plastocyanin/azurin family copper-binding protein [Actinomycetota bacterium]